MVDVKMKRVKGEQDKRRIVAVAARVPQARKIPEKRQLDVVV